jgi:hypothetical protein
MVYFSVELIDENDKTPVHSVNNSLLISSEALHLQ